MDAAIDATGRIHVVGQCGNGFSYLVSTLGSSWNETEFPAPAHATVTGAHIALDGAATYFAWDQLGDGGCGDPGYAAVYYRAQLASGGAWLAPTRIGARGDGLESFFVSRGTILATVENAQSSFFETVHGDTIHRYPIGDADPAGAVSLQIGSDGVARIAYWAPSGIRYGVFNGTGFTTTTVFKQDGFAWGPSLVLDASNNPHIMWIHSPPPGGCAGPDGTPNDGTYYSTMSGGSWTSTRITPEEGGSVFQVNAATGAAYVLVDTSAATQVFTRSAAGAWTGATLTTIPTVNQAILLDPANGTLVVVFAAYGAKPGFYVMSKPLG